MAIFERSEYLERIEKTKRRMEDSGIETLLITSPENMNYLTGYNGWSFYTHQMVVLSIEDGEPAWVGRGLDVPCAEFTVFMEKTHIVGYPDCYVQSAHRHEMDFIADFVRQRRLSSGRIGVETDNYYFTAKCMEKLREKLPDATFVDASGLVNWVRVVKSPQEIEWMRQAGKIAERAMETAISTIDAEVRECDAAASIVGAQIRGTEEFGGDSTGIAMGTGAKARAPHLQWTDERFARGQAVTVELGGCRHRYHSGLSRTIYLGRPPEELVDLAGVVIEGLDVTLDFVAPGKSCEEIEGRWRQVLAKAGLSKESRIGYSIGLGYPPDWGEHTASLRAGDTTELEPNMTFHMILGMWNNPTSFVISETFRVTDAGSETFSSMPRQLFVK